jgi:hypothetical protein
MRNLCGNWRVWVVAAGMVIVAARPAHAFYWYGWPGSGTPPHHTIHPPGGGSSGGTGSHGNGSGGGTAPPDNGSGNPPGGGGGTTPPDGGGSHHGGGPSTPEPATALVAIFGIGALGIRRGVRWLKAG